MASIRYLKSKLKQFKPLCYKITPYTLDEENRLTCSDPVPNLNLYPRSNQFYIDFLVSITKDGHTHFYSKADDRTKSCIDLFVGLGLFTISDDIVIYNDELIKIWTESYFQSFNWCIYY